MGANFSEREGFEPSKPCGLQVFETCCFNHSHTSPFLPLPSGGRGQLYLLYQTWNNLPINAIALAEINQLWGQPN